MIHLMLKYIPYRISLNKVIIISNQATVHAFMIVFFIHWDTKRFGETVSPKVSAILSAKKCLPLKPP